MDKDRLQNAREESDRKEFEQGLGRRLNAYAWLIFLIATAVLMSQWSDELTAWIKNALVFSSSASR